MSNISDAFDKIVLTMDTLFPEHLRIHNPYEPEKGSEQVLRKGWGIIFGPGVRRTDRQIGCTYSWQRNMVILQFRQYLGTQLTTDKNASKQKDLMEDQIIMLDEFEKNVQLTQGGTGPDIVRFDPDSDTGITFVFPDRFDFFMIQTTFELEYFRQL